MNWEAIGAIAELLGAIGVIASLVYLAQQIRQSREQIRHGQEQMERNTRAMRAAAFQQLDQNIYGAFSPVLTVPGMSRVQRLGMSDYQQLDEEDAYLFSMFLSSQMMRLDNGYFQYRAGMLDEQSWLILFRNLRGFFLNPGCCQWWRAQQQKLYLSAEFVALVEEIVAKEAGRGAS